MVKKVTAALVVGKILEIAIVISVAVAIRRFGRALLDYLNVIMEEEEA